MDFPNKSYPFDLFNLPTKVMIFFLLFKFTLFFCADWLITTNFSLFT